LRRSRSTLHYHSIPADDEAALAASLQAEWSADTAAVYADVLIARGDPRGELIAIDLALATEPRAELALRKRELIELWIGESIAGWKWQPRNIEHGLVSGFAGANSATFEMVEQVQHLIDAVGNHIRDLWLYGTNADLKKSLTALARTDGGLPWLRKLTLNRVDGARPIERAIWQPVVEATPHLTELILEGKGVLASPLHPAVRTLRIQGFAIAVGGQPFDGVTHLDFQFADPHAYGAELPSIDKLVAAVNPRAFPALRILDLSRNVAPRWSQPAHPVALEFLAAVEELARFERIRLPAISNDSARVLVELLERYPQLVIEIARIYEALDVHHPRLHVPVPRVWPAQPHSRDALIVAKYGEELSLSTLVDDLEEQFDAMRPEAQAAWIAFWSFLAELPWEDELGNPIQKQLSARTLGTALDALDGNRRGDTVVAALRAANLAPEAMVTISRYWGW
jgi:hypothetical protein